jgi:hypothetical protein
MGTARMLPPVTTVANFVSRRSALNQAVLTPLAPAGTRAAASWSWGAVACRPTFRWRPARSVREI